MAPEPAPLGCVREDSPKHRASDWRHVDAGIVTCGFCHPPPFPEEELEHRGPDGTFVQRLRESHDRGEHEPRREQKREPAGQKKRTPEVHPGQDRQASLDL